MKISIIIPSLNEEKHIVRTLTALQYLRKNGHQVILCDAHSQDKTQTLAKPLVDNIICADAGRAKQMNAAAKIAQHELLWFVHADTQIPENADQLIFQHLQKTAAVWGRFDVRLSGSSWLFRIIEKMINLRSCLSGIASGDQGIFVRGDIFKKVGTYENIPLMEDISLSKKLKKISPPCCISTPLMTSSRRWEQRGIMRTVWLMWYCRLAYFLGTPAEKLVQIYQRP